MTTADKLRADSSSCARPGEESLELARSSVDLCSRLRPLRAVERAEPTSSRRTWRCAVSTRASTCAARFGSPSRSRVRSTCRRRWRRRAGAASADGTCRPNVQTVTQMSKLSPVWPICQVNGARVGSRLRRLPRCAWQLSPRCPIRQPNDRSVNQMTDPSTKRPTRESTFSRTVAHSSSFWTRSRARTRSSGARMAAQRSKKNT